MVDKYRARQRKDRAERNEERDERYVVINGDRWYWIAGFSNVVIRHPGGSKRTVHNIWDLLPNYQGDPEAYTKDRSRRAWSWYHDKDFEPSTALTPALVKAFILKTFTLPTEQFGIKVDLTV